MGTIRDDRTDDERKATACYIVGTDRVLSGWGQAPGRSFYAVACANTDEAAIVEANFRDRKDMMRVRFCLRGWRPRLGPGDYCAIVGRDQAPRWFKAGAMHQD